jgi:hypothetical protein
LHRVEVFSFHVWKKKLEKFSARKVIALADGLRRLLETHPELQAASAAD